MKKMGVRRHILMAVCLAKLAIAGAAENNRTTDAAFAALLSMPGANQGWNIPVPAGFARRNEKELTDFLGKQLAAGADVNAYRHYGTLLHHAIRSGQQGAAIWLLEHGAKPELSLRDAPMDAMDLAVQGKRNKVIKLLQDKYGMSAKAAAAKDSLPASEQSKVLDGLRKSLKTSASLEHYLAGLPDAVVARQQSAIVFNLAVNSGGWDPDAKVLKYTLSPDHWRAAWRRLPRPIDYSESYGLATRLPPRLWPELAASGYPMKDTGFATRCMFSDLPLNTLKSMWPAIEGSFPALRQDAMQLLVSYYTMSDDWSCGSEPVDFAAKLVWLESKGIKGPVYGLSERKLGDLEPDLQARLKRYQAPAAPLRFTAASRECKFTMTDAWFSALQEEAGHAVQLVELPDQRTCGVYVTIPPSFSSEDGFDGSEPSPVASCPDRKPVQRLLLERNGKIVATELAHISGDPESPAPLQLVNDKVTGKRLYVRMGSEAGKCSINALPTLLGWRNNAGGLELADLDSPELRRALAMQCHETDSIDCDGIREDGPIETTYGQDMLNKLGAERRAVYLAAVMALDREKLKGLEAVGVPGRWTGEALIAVGESNLPLEEKRKRIARLFYDHKQLANAVSQPELESLLGWLPLQDWKPVVDILAYRSDQFVFDQLREKFVEKGWQRLACDLDNARGLLCGERGSQ